MARHRDKAHPLDPATASFQQAMTQLDGHPMFAPMMLHARVYRAKWSRCPDDAWAIVGPEGDIHVHPTVRLPPEQWLYIISHCLLHLAFRHFRPHEHHREWNTACDCVVARFQRDLKLGQPPAEVHPPRDLPSGDEDHLYRLFVEQGIPEHLRCLGAARAGNDMIRGVARETSWYRPFDWAACFGKGLAAAVASAVNVAAGREAHLGAGQSTNSAAQAARAWFLSSYPLLGSLAAAFKIIEDPLACARMQVSVAAIDAEIGEMYLNPSAGLSADEFRFVIAHELLHVGLRHQARRLGRDPFLWNIACDYLINGWLVEMNLGQLPRIGSLYDPELKGLSAEAIYDRIVTDMRRHRKLATLRGIGLGDLLERGQPDWWARGDGLTLDDFYRRCITQGLLYHDDQGRGLLPAGLVEEIRALDQPPIAWDVQLAQWFEQHFEPLEKRRTYARPSRRQAATPDIPRPRWVVAAGAEDGRTFGVVLDTSGSMDRKLLAKSLGAIASYSISRDVPAVRVVFCDAAAYDAGYMPPEAIVENVHVKGRGGTVLQPGIDLLERAADFPAEGPILVITDGQCDRLRIAREHAFLIPEGRHLPFPPHGPVFYIQ